jgi:hypothetical protein
MRRAPAARAASTRLRAPTVRMRALPSNWASPLGASSCGRSLSSSITISGFSAASTSCRRSRSNTSTATPRPPSRVMVAARSRERLKPTTS